MSTPITNESARLAASDYETWRANQAMNERKRWAQLVAALRALPTGCLDCEIEALVAAHMVASLPDIGPDPLKSDLPRDIAAARQRLQSGLDRQQFGVPDQAALVWRADISTVSVELTWRTAQAKQFAPILKTLCDSQAPKPFATAPKDGSEFLSWEETTGWLLVRWIAPSEFVTERELAKLDLDNPDTPDWFVADFVSGSRLAIQPTHWLPLPERPKVMPACKGTNCGCTDGFSHSPECKAEHDALCSE